MGLRGRPSGDSLIIPKQPVDAFFRYVNLRYDVYLKKESGAKPPWTDDPALREWSFTNVFRDLDRGTVWLDENLLKPNAYVKPLGDVLFNVVLYRTFNWIPTGEFFGWVSSWKPAAIKDALRARQIRGHKVFTSAHLVRSEAGRSKIDSVIDYLTPIWEDRVRIATILRERKSMQFGFRQLCSYQYIGDFMSYQYVLDLIKTPVLDQSLDIETWAVVGPGAWKGLRFMDPNLEKRHGLRAMRELTAVAPKFLSQEILTCGRPFGLHDVEFSLCEFSKYVRVWHGASGKNRYQPPAIRFGRGVNRTEYSYAKDSHYLARAAAEEGDE